MDNHKERIEQQKEIKKQLIELPSTIHRDCFDEKIKKPIPSINKNLYEIIAHNQRINQSIKKVSMENIIKRYNLNFEKYPTNDMKHKLIKIYSLFFGFSENIFNNNFIQKTLYLKLFDFFKENKEKILFTIKNIDYLEWDYTSHFRRRNSILRNFFYLFKNQEVYNEITQNPENLNIIKEYIESSREICKQYQYQNIKNNIHNQKNIIMLHQINNLLNKFNITKANYQDLLKDTKKVQEINNYLQTASQIELEQTYPLRISEHDLNFFKEFKLIILKNDKNYTYDETTGNFIFNKVTYKKVFNLNFDTLNDLFKQFII